MRPQYALRGDRECRSLVSQFSGGTAFFHNRPFAVVVYLLS